ncbi:MAG: hypothetical protein WD845_12350 [Pirellulales bacterium]
MTLISPTPIISENARQGRNPGVVVRFAEMDSFAGQIVAAALVRSFTAAQVTCQPASPAVDVGACAVWINPAEDTADDLSQLLASGGKAVVLGRIGPRVAQTLGLQWHGSLPPAADWAACRPDATSHHDESPARIEYVAAHPLATLSPHRRRPLCRFDFADEWNNLGYGRITASGDDWSLQTAVTFATAMPLARLALPGDRRLAYAALYETPRGAALWFNRPVGPVDSLEWRVVESFLSDYRADDLPCLPCLNEIPAGYRAAVCARLDCDEAVASARPLVDLYRECGVPLSLALLTGQPIDAADIQLLRDVLSAGGSVVPHSVRHEPNWGGSYERAFAEASESRAWFERHLPEAAPVRYAVSPFHQNPPYAVAALADSGYDGFLGGIIANDPEYLLGRAGRVPFAPQPMVSHSGQCMLHGECFARYGRSMDVYCASFDQHVSGRAIFGYLDHPFSSRYQYGWSDEATRVTAHRQLIEHMQRQQGVWWANIVQVLDFLKRRDATELFLDSAGRLSIEAPTDATGPALGIRWKGQDLAA